MPFGQNPDNFKIAVGTATAFGVMLYLRSRVRLSSAPESKYAKKSTLPEIVKFIGNDQYAVLAAIVDAILPARSVNECNAIINDLLPNTVFDLMDKKAISKNNGFLCSGALNYGTHRHIAETLQLFATKEDQNQLYLILSILGTSVGCLALTGYPMPFQNLPLDDRQNILRSFANSNLTAIRNVFQTFRRLTGDLFLSYAEPGKKNPHWEAMEYFPEKTVSARNYEEENASSCDDHHHDASHTHNASCGTKSKDSILRSMISYEYVANALKNKKESTEDIDILNVDIVIIGSGSGGGTVAHELVQAGFQVLVIEKNGYYRASEFQAWRECEAMANVYDKGGLITSVDGAISILAGSCVGGGSTINWSASFAPPKTVLQDWATSGLASFQEGGEFSRSLARVHELFHINSDFSYYDEKETETTQFSYSVNPNNRALWKGAETLGYKVEKIPRNVTQCVNCGHCTYGCSHESKQSTIHGLLEPLLMNQFAQEGAEAAQLQASSTTGKHISFTPSATKQGKLYILPDCKIDTILHQVGDRKEKKAIGAEGVVTFYAKTSDGKVIKESVVRVPQSTKKVRICSNLVVVSAGSIQTPALLLRSHFEHPMIGRNLTLHPVVPCVGQTTNDVNTDVNGGVSMGVVIKDAVTQYRTSTSPHTSAISSYTVNTAQYPIAIETPPAHAGITGLLIPWNHDLSYKLIALAYPHVLAFLQFPRDHCYPHNRITIDSEGNPVVQYTISKEDTENILNGLEITMRMMKAAKQPDCVSMMMGNVSDWWYADPKKTLAENDASFEAYVQLVRQTGIVPCSSVVFSAHQMSSCRMSFNPKEGPTSPSGELYECENCFIADGSVLPSSLGINPMITIESTAHMIAQKIIRHHRTTG